jgi:putative pyruvate formate lyase activating enzyme
MMIELQERGCHNINLVTPAQFVAQILGAVDLAAADGLRIPLVFNSGGFESVSTLRRLEGVVDLWLPDAKYADDAVAWRLSGFPDYSEHNHNTLREICRQVGSQLMVDEEGIARRGMIVRHLVLPNGLAGTDRIMRWLAAELSPDTYVSLMDQYFPAYKAVNHPSLSRKVTEAEYGAAVEAFESAGLRNGWMQEHEMCEDWQEDD